MAAMQGPKARGPGRVAAALLLSSLLAAGARADEAVPPVLREGIHLEGTFLNLTLSDGGRFRLWSHACGACTDAAGAWTRLGEGRFELLPDGRRAWSLWQAPAKGVHRAVPVLVPVAAERIVVVVEGEDVRVEGTAAAEPFVQEWAPGRICAACAGRRPTGWASCPAALPPVTCADRRQEDGRAQRAAGNRSASPDSPSTASTPASASRSGPRQRSASRSSASGTSGRSVARVR